MSGGDGRRFDRLTQHLPGRRYWSRYRFCSGNSVRLFTAGETYFAALIERIDAAKSNVALETYIFCDDASGRPVSDALVRAATRGVRVRVITDGVGTERLPMFNDWQAAGIEHRIYNPHIFGRFGFSRTHRKLAVVDDEFGYCGGINVVDDYDQNGTRLPYARWDFAVELEGPVVADVLEAFDVQWERIRIGHRPALVPPPVGGATPQAATERFVRVRRSARTADMRAMAEPCVAFVARDNFVNRRAIEKAYLTAIGQARSEVLLANPYFMPGRKLRRADLRGATRHRRASRDRQEGIRDARLRGAVPVSDVAEGGREDRRIRKDDAARQGRRGRFELGHGRLVESRRAEPDAEQRGERRARAAP